MGFSGEEFCVCVQDCDDKQNSAVKIKDLCNDT